MKKLLFAILLAAAMMPMKVSAQLDFTIINPTLSPLPAIYPGGLENAGFDFVVSQGQFTFSSNPSSNNSGLIQVSFSQLDPTGILPTGTGAALFTWTLTDNGGTGAAKVYTWTGLTKDVTVGNVSGLPKNYHVGFANVPVTYPAEIDPTIGFRATWTDPLNAPSGQDANNTSSRYTLSTAGSTTPVKLVNFNATKQGTEVFLTWATAQESNSSRYEVERSSDGGTFAKIGTIKAAGNSTATSSYNFTDAAPLAGNNYYRLKMIDIDNRFEYSPVRIVNFGDVASDIKIYPNPFTEKVSIAINSNIADNAMVTVFDNAGKLVFNRKDAIQKGTNVLIINNLNKLAAGSYIVQIKLKDKTITQKLIK